MWKAGFSKLLQFKEREGHCLVPNHLNEDDYPLGKWVSRQRQAEQAMFPERKHRLDALGFVWNQLEHSWEAALSKLRQFKEREGHCIVPDKHNEDGHNLGKWVGKQRTNKDKLTLDRIKRLNALGFVWKAR
ncbi:helicase associated domain-containing protein [Paracoccaceae bacterium]|nr:helicase associated domain-containing protein [Paracoccaceae bacterium]